MTDFFADLEGHLQRAARRRARRGPRVAMAVAAATAAAALVFALLSAIDAPNDPEVLAPAPTTTPTAAQHACDGPPAVVLNRFAVLRREPTDADRAPDGVLERIDQDFPGVGRPERMWPEAGRLARVIGEREVWLFPVALRDCAPGLCWVQEPVAYCHALADVRRPISLGIEEGPTPSATALVPDGRRAVGVAGKRRLPGTTEGNIFFAEGANDIAEDAPEVSVGCDAPGVTTEAPAPELLDIVPDLRDGPLRLPDDTWRKALSGHRVVAHVHHARAFGEHAGTEIFGVAYARLPGDCILPGDPVEPGACLVATRDRSEFFAYCFIGRRIVEGTATVRDLDVDLVYALVPNGTRRATYGSTELSVEGNFAYGTTKDRDARLRLID